MPVRHTTLIDPATLATRIIEGADSLCIIDCRADLLDPEAGARAFAERHLPGARFLDLAQDLSGSKTGTNGRHPLPDRDALAARLAALGVQHHTQIVAYDAHGGSYAARLWWLLRWLGHADVAVLDGGFQAWEAEGGLVEFSEPRPATPGDFAPRAPLVGTIDAAAILADIGRGAWQVVDARAPERFRGDEEPIDPVGGHIPGARNRFFKDNLDAEGRFKPAAALREEFAALLGARPATQTVMQCGSGVTACHNLLALEVAGLGGAVLYPGSWSEWTADPARPVATGPAT
ncbi:sulfurtransferase [Robbsia sp. Bb-Pol-6]|uniref:Sulfurtransferase n=1 Tax=Robbsia betulipollinis TaxID=2981849 RepID=A0ABT3ZN58_9BURK|nr:sulfurtransferase [Robbsia betulipollinis]MCY0387690.1 sulfurtransferase [Robbsia betulipollinis]